MTRRNSKGQRESRSGKGRACTEWRKSWMFQNGLSAIEETVRGSRDVTRRSNLGSLLAERWQRLGGSSQSQGKHSKCEA